LARLAGTPVPKAERFDAVLLPRSVRPNSPFYLGHLPQLWAPAPTDRTAGIVTAIEWLPILGTIPVDPGCNGVEKNGRGAPNAEPAIAKWQGKGGVVLRHGDPRLGQWADYMAVFDSVTGRPVYRTIFARIEVLGKLHEEHSDEDDYNDFRRHLVESGVVRPIEPMVARKVLARYEAQLSRIVGLIGSRPGHTGLQDRVDRAQGWVDAIRAGMPTQDDERTVAPKAVRGRAVRAPASPEATA